MANARTSVTPFAAMTGHAPEVEGGIVRSHEEVSIRRDVRERELVAKPLPEPAPPRQPDLEPLGDAPVERRGDAAHQVRERAALLVADLEVDEESALGDE